MENQTDKVVNWFEGIWDSHKYDKGTRDEIRDRVQSDVSINHFTNEELGDLGEWVWDDWTDFEGIISRYPLPEIKTELVKWADVGKYLVATLNLKLWEWDEDDED